MCLKHQQQQQQQKNPYIIIIKCTNHLLKAQNTKGKEILRKELLGAADNVEENTKRNHVRSAHILKNWFSTEGCPKGLQFLSVFFH